MYQLIDTLKERVSKLVSDKLYNAYKVEMRSAYLRYESLQSQIDKILHSDDSPLEKSKATHVLLDYSLYEQEGQSIDTFSSIFITELEEIINSLPEYLTEEQQAERFQKQTNDSLRIRLLKPWKKWAFSITDTPRRSANLFRKNKKPIRYWNHKVPLKALAKKHLQIIFIEKITPLKRNYWRAFTKAYSEILVNSVDQNHHLTDPKSLQQELSKIRNALKKELLNILDTRLSELINDAELVGTIELKASRFSPKRLNTEWNNIQNLWKSENKQWNNTFLLLHEEWSSDLELKKLSHLSIEALRIYTSSQSKIFEQSLKPDLEKVIEFIDQINYAIDSTDELSQTLKSSNYKAQKQLDEQVIPTLVEKLSNKNSINAIARLENTINQGLKERNIDLRLSKSTTQYLEPIQTNNIATIPLYELITFEITPALFKEIDRIKANLLTGLNQQITVTGDLDHMITFGLSTAIQQLDETDLESAQNVAKESLLRAKDRVIEIKNELSNLFLNIDKSLSDAISRYNTELEALMVNENIREMRLRIAKAKTIQQTKAYRIEIKDQVTSYLENTRTYLFTRYEGINKFVTSFRQRFFLTSKKQSVSRSVSDFLSGAENRINSLPVIYRNLYKTEPLTDHELFVGRSAELHELTEAYTKWSEGKMGSTILFGEKLSGMTSLLNYLQTSNTFKHPTSRFKCTNTEDTMSHLTEILKKITSAKEIDSIAEVQDLLLNGPKRVIILEDIQNLYLRKPGGFNTINALLTLISHTSSKVYWTASCTLYTWEYFKKTLQIQEIFSYHIGLKKPSEDQLYEIIQKRNRISGYKIHFEPDSSDHKKTSKLNTEELQELLRKKFFKNLIDFSESNITMALTYWLLSTKSVDQNQIVINSFQKPDLSFLEILTMEKVLSLHALIIHDGLTVEQFAQVTRKKPQAAHLLLSMMLEDGILVQKAMQYQVNTLVYRNVISLLKAKNLIY